MRRQAMDQEKMFAKYRFDKGLLSKIYNELWNLNNDKTNNLILKLVKELNRYLTREDLQMKSIQKNAPHHMSSGKWKLKPQWDIIIYLIKWPKFRTLTPPNAGKEVKQQELSSIAGGDAKWYSRFGRRFGGYKTKHPLTTQPINCAQNIWKLMSTQKLASFLQAEISIYASFILAKTW